jgi:hypothetical protein
MKTGCAKFLRVEYNRRITETGVNELLACIETLRRKFRRVVSWPANRQLMHCHCGLARILHQAEATPNATRSWCGLKRNGARETFVKRHTFGRSVKER